MPTHARETTETLAAGHEHHGIRASRKKLTNLTLVRGVVDYDNAIKPMECGSVLRHLVSRAWGDLLSRESQGSQEAL